MTVGITGATLSCVRAQPTTGSERVSINSDGEQANGNSTYPALSNDARFVAFQSDAANLVPDDTNNTSDAFLYDRVEGQTFRVSEATSGGQGNGASHSPVISGNGRFVAFETHATNLSVKLDRNRQPDIYVHDRRTGQTNRVNINNAGKQADGESSDPSISDDGRYVAFTSAATNLSVKGDNNGTWDVFVYDRSTRKTNRVSVNSQGKEGNSSSYEPSISGDGRYIAFTSRARNLADNDRNGSADVFVYDRKAQTTRRVSVASGGQQANDQSMTPAISSNGRFVTFISDATNLVPDDTNAATDVFVHDLKTGRTTAASVSSSGDLGNGPAASDGEYTLGISPNGTKVSFVSFATNLVDGDVNNSPDAFVHDRITGETVRVGRQSMTSDVTNTFVTYDSNAPDETMADTNQAWDIFVRPL
jgi:Tol biopolymer transport system component